MLKRAIPLIIAGASISLPSTARSPAWDSAVVSEPVLVVQAKVTARNSERNAKLADAASINEDLIGFALDGKADKVAQKVVEMRKALATLRPLLGDHVFEVVGQRVSDMEKSSAKGDILGVALASVEAYRTLGHAMDTASRLSPIEVAMLDYSGFKLSMQ